MVERILARDEYSHLVPEVSVIMSVYNAAPYLADAVESMLSQTLSNFEFIILDDGSTDRSLEILEEYAHRDERIRIVAQKHEGLTYRLNEGILVSRGEFIARMDADDVSLKLRLEHQVNYLRENPRCVAVGCDLLVIDGDGKPIGVSRHKTNPISIEELLLNGAHGVIAHAACVMRRATLVAIGGYREEFESIEDFDLWFRLAEKGQLANLPEVLFKYRLNPTSVCSTQFKQQELHADVIVTEARLRRGLKPLGRSVWTPVHSSNEDVARLQLWAIYISGLGNRRVALRYAFLSLYREPLSLTSWSTVLRVMLPQWVKHGLKRILRLA